MVRVAVIGAGASGLTAIKCCLDEGVDVTCFEGSDHIGGLWYFTEEEEHSSICRTTVINTSKEMMSYSDFPVPKDFPVYMHNTKVLEYLRLYSKHFNGEKYIKFNTRVVKVKRTSENSDCKYEITYTKYGKEITHQETEVFDAVMVCSGHHWKKILPSFEGMSRFKGIQMHSKAYKDYRKFKDKVVVVVGIGNSGGDIAVDLSRHCKQVFLSTRKGAWVLPRTKEGYPMDQWKNRRVINYLPKKLLLPIFVSKLQQQYDLEKLGLKPKTSILSHHPMVNDLLPWKILECSIIVKPNVKCLGETSVEFDDGSVVDGVDAVIYATGYEIGFPYLSEGLVKCENNRIELYKYVFPPDQCNLAVIGCVQPLGALMPLSELQARWAVRVFKGILTLPPSEKMLDDIEEKWIAMQKVYYASKRHTVQVNYITYADELSSQIGCCPNLWKILGTDPLLGLYCFFGPVYPYQYRLQGPGKWSGARKALFSAEGNIKAAMMTRKIEDDTSGSLLRTLFSVFVIVVLSAFILFFIRH